MMTMRNILFIFASFCFLSLFGQQTEIDKSRFVAIYQYSCRTTDKEGDPVIDTKKLAVQVGNKVTHCYSYLDFSREFEDIEYETVSQDMIRYAEELYVLMPEVWINYPEGKITTKEEIFPHVYKATSNKTSIQWTLDDYTEEEAGYECKTARGNLNGKTWKVWYSEEIPSSAGPWKLCGLPGLIVKAIDEDSIHEFCLEQLLSVESSICYDEDPTEISVSEKKMIGFRNQTYGNAKFASDPYYYLPDVNASITLMEVFKNKDKALVKLNGKFLMKEDAHTYQPIELK